MHKKGADAPDLGFTRDRHADADLSRESRRLEIGSGGLAPALVGLDLEADLLPLDEVVHAGTLDGRDVHEHIRSPAVLHDEAEALLGVEKLDGTCGHMALLE